MDDQFKNLNDDQKEQVKMLFEKHQHDDMKVTIPISGHGHDDYQALENFIVHEGVWNPTVVASLYHASFLYYNNTRLFYNKKVLDMGTGTGLMGITMALHGAKSVMMADISKLAVENAKANIEQFNLKSKCEVIESDLFTNITNKFDFIVFNHPYFEENAPDGDTIASSMMMSESTIDKFLESSKNHLLDGGKIMMPYYTPAGKANDPSVKGPKYGFSVDTTYATIVDEKINGQIVIYELTLN